MFRILHGIGFSESETQFQKATIFSNVISSMIKILDAMNMYKISFDDLEREVIRLAFIKPIIFKIFQFCKVDANTIIQASKLDNKNLNLSLSIATALKKLWADVGVQECYSRGNEYNLNDSTK